MALNGSNRGNRELKLDDDGCENVAKKMNLRPFKFSLAYLDPLQLSNVGDLPGVEFLRT